VLEVTSATVAFGRHVAVDDVSVEVPSGEVLAILGPSGCGKSTLLRAVAGLQPLDAGTVRWDGEDLAGVPVHHRDFGLMFQEHALFSHRDVAANVSFGLRMRKVAPAARRRRVHEVLTLVGLAGFEDREIATLSGGEAQRVALARSLAPEPRLLMLDEPLGSLDRPRRDQLAEELRTVLRSLGATVMHVTHDHDEAFAVADRVAVMQSGRIARIGTPADIWHDPRRRDVAEFLGHSNIVEVGEGGAVPWGTLQAAPGTVVVRSDAFRRISPAESVPRTASTQRTGAVAGTVNTVTGTVTDVRFRGDRYEITLRTASTPAVHTLVVRDSQTAHAGEQLSYKLNPSAIVTVN